MKNVLSAMALFGVMVVFRGSAFAQTGVVVDVDGSDGLKPAVGQNIAPAIRNGGQQATVLMHRDCAGSALLQRARSMTEVENPKNVDVIKGDKVDVDLWAKTILVSRGNNPAPLVKITY